MVRLLFILLFSVSVCYGQANRFAGFGSRVTFGCSSVTYLTKAQMFIDSSGITDTVEIRAIKELTKDLMDSCLWDSLYVVAPLVGSTNNSTRYNLISNNYQITWHGTGTFGAYGVQGNGTNFYGSFGFNPSVDYTSPFNILFGIYLGLNIDAVQSAIGSVNGVFAGYNIFPRTSNTLYSNSGETLGSSSYTNTDSKGLYLVTRKAPITAITLKNGITIATNLGILAFPSPTYEMLIGARSDSGTPLYFSTNKIGLVVVGRGLIYEESIRLSNIFQKFLNTLGR